VGLAEDVPDAVISGLLRRQVGARDLRQLVVRVVGVLRAVVVGVGDLGQVPVGVVVEVGQAPQGIGGEGVEPERVGRVTGDVGCGVCAGLGRSAGADHGGQPSDSVVAVLREVAGGQDRVLRGGEVAVGVV